ncbi:unnamed protein product [Acanthosepion pharaonis]|uniref:Uncharacterized protein n=1 Tax=Acanthosepion pharaonis TaxID=158019 RepID=A0A812CHC0_ACAPH|nr:unnamed protein product [Sepia pharaonis]
MTPRLDYTARAHRVSGLLNILPGIIACRIHPIHGVLWLGSPISHLLNPSLPFLAASSPINLPLFREANVLSRNLSFTLSMTSFYSLCSSVVVFFFSFVFLTVLFLYFLFSFPPFIPIIIFIVSLSPLSFPLPSLFPSPLSLPLSPLSFPLSLPLSLSPPSLSLTLSLSLSLSLLRVNS